MWPSMQSSVSATSGRGQTGGMIDLNHSMDDETQAEHDELLEELLLEGVGGVAASSKTLPPRNGKVDLPPAKVDDDGDDEDKELVAQMHAFVKDAERKAKGPGFGLGEVNDAPFSPYDFEGPGSASNSTTKPWVTTPLSISIDDNMKADPMSMSPTDMGSLTPFGTKGPSAAGDDEGRQVSLGFEDDFTVFVSAPATGPRSQQQPNGKAKPFSLDLGDAAFGNAEMDPDVPTPTASGMSMKSGLMSTQATAGLTSAGGLTTAGLVSAGPESAHGYVSGLGLGSRLGKSSAYRSLGSVSDFGESDAEEGQDVYEVLEDDNADEHYADSGTSSNDDEDPDLPSQEEVRSAARRIFGAELSEKSLDPSDHLQTEANDADDGRPFDLEKVLGALQGYKTKIASMSDEEERRKAAAKVALGLVYGLEGGANSSRRN